jgi:hypothetical protein
VGPVPEAPTIRSPKPSRLTSPAALTESPNRLPRATPLILNPLCHRVSRGLDWRQTRSPCQRRRNSPGIVAVGISAIRADDHVTKAVTIDIASRAYGASRNIARRDAAEAKPLLPSSVERFRLAANPLALPKTT